MRILWLVGHIRPGSRVVIYIKRPTEERDS